MTPCHTSACVVQEVTQADTRPPHHAPPRVAWRGQVVITAGSDLPDAGLQVPPAQTAASAPIPVGKKLEHDEQVSGYTQNVTLAAQANSVRILTYLVHFGVLFPPGYFVEVLKSDKTQITC